MTTLRTMKAIGPSKRVVVLFKLDDYDLIKDEVTRREQESGYTVTVADVLRDLVREKWKGKDDTKPNAILDASRQRSNDKWLRHHAERF
ncbi:MAG: hypothetical protein ACE1Y4_06935 [Lysobacterales bacterium]